jgi:hypothetical protein
MDDVLGKNVVHAVEEKDGLQVKRNIEEGISNNLRCIFRFKAVHCFLLTRFFSMEYVSGHPSRGQKIFIPIMITNG